MSRSAAATDAIAFQPAAAAAVASSYGHATDAISYGHAAAAVAIAIAFQSAAATIAIPAWPQPSMTRQEPETTPR